MEQRTTDDAVVKAPTVDAAPLPAPMALCDEPDCLPAFRVKTIDGATIASDDYRGKPVLVMFWASWCEPCITEGPSISRVYQRHKDEGFAMVGLSRDEVDDATLRKFRDHYHLVFPIALATPQAYEAFGSPPDVPTFLLYGRDGRRAARFTGALPADILEREVGRLLK